MAVTDSYLQMEWYKWKRLMERKRKQRWRRRVSRSGGWAKMQLAGAREGYVEAGRIGNSEDEEEEVSEEEEGAIEETKAHVAAEAKVRLEKKGKVDEGAMKIYNERKAVGEADKDPEVIKEVKVEEEANEEEQTNREGKGEEWKVEGMQKSTENAAEGTEEPAVAKQEPRIGRDQTQTHGDDLDSSVEPFQANGHSEELANPTYEQRQQCQKDCFPMAPTVQKNCSSQGEENRDFTPEADIEEASSSYNNFVLPSTQDEQGKQKEEQVMSTDDETDENSTEDDLEDEADVVKVYSRDSHASDIFSTLKEFRDSSILTDLTLFTEDGKSFPAHSPVLAAVSALVKNRLKDRAVGRGRSGERQKDSTDIKAQRWSVCLGPEVDLVGLRAILEFAYTGAIAGLNRDTATQIKAAAQTLGVPRVMDLCAKLNVDKNEEEIGTEERVRAAEQMKISLKCIKELWMEKVGCDVVLEPLGASLHVHKVILAASSDYFRGMFTSGMKESHQPHVVLPFLLASDLVPLIGSSYSGVLRLTWGIIFEITGISLQLQYQPTLPLCLYFLKNELNPHSCLDVVSFAETFEMADVLEAANDFVLRQFQKVARTSKFKDLPEKQLLKYLNSLSLCVPSELVVFKAVVAWIQAKPKRRLRFAENLMKTINFPLMTFMEFKEVQNMNMWSNHSLSDLYENIFQDFCSTDGALESECRVYLPKESLVLVGGDQITEDFNCRSTSRDMWFGNSVRNHTGIRKVMEWRKLGVIPESSRFSHEVAVLRGQLYVIGGRSYYGTEDLLNSTYRFDPLKNSWERLADMHAPRSFFSVTVLEGMLYAIGGHCGLYSVETVERYCPTTNSWSFMQPLDMELNGHVARSLHDQIFVSGGLNSRNECLVSMFLYHPKKGSTYLADMAKPRAYHCMETLDGLLYVAGGISKDNMATVDMLACEVYSPTNNSWTAFTPLPMAHVGAGSVVLEGKFYVLGGYSHENYYDIKRAHRYDSTSQKWENMGKMPGPNNDLRAAVLCLPSNLRS